MYERRIVAQQSGSVMGLAAETIAMLPHVGARSLLENGLLLLKGGRYLRQAIQ
jgi:hypothetical protein